MEEKSINFTLYKTSLILIKYGPLLIAVINFIAVILGCFGIVTSLFTVGFQLSIIATLLWILLSFTFKCCIWHRLPLYYCWTNNIISWIDFRWTIPVSNMQMILIHCLIVLIFIILGMYFKNRYNVRKRSEERTT